MPALAASAEDARQPYELTWRKPDGTLSALLFMVLPVERAEDELTVEFFRIADQQPATSLAGMPVWLAGVAGEIDALGTASFRWCDLPADSKLDILEVGPDREAWELEGGC